MAGPLADTGGTRYGDGCAGGERGGATTARAVCAEVLSVVHGIADCNPRAGNRTPRAEALAIGRYAIGYRRIPAGGTAGLNNYREGIFRSKRNVLADETCYNTRTK